jgi:Ca-activated chloride channel family protein
MDMAIRNQLRNVAILTVLIYFACFLHGQDQKLPTPLFKVEVDTVFVKVIVSDSLNRYITGLKKEHFKVYEDNIQQDIVHFSQESAPVSVGFVFDISGSMGFDSNIRIGKNWLAGFLKSNFLESRNPGDEYSLITFNQTVNLVQTFTGNSSEIQNEIALDKPGGWTALYDAVYRGVDYMKEGRNDKKALIVITDGEDNSSRYHRTDVQEYLKESNVQIYGVMVPGELGYGVNIVQSLASLTGGRSFFADWNDLGYYLNLIHAELRNQYLIGYIPSNNKRDGKWRRIKVKLDPPRGTPKFHIRAKEGYYAWNY